MSAGMQPSVPARRAPRAPRPRRLTPADFQTVNRAALPQLEALCARWLAGGRRQGREWKCGSLDGEAGDSCSVNLETGRWADFATGDKGGDPVSLTAAIHRLSQGEAARRLAGMLGLNLGGQPHV